MNTDEFRAFWNINWGQCPPIGYRLRATYRERWFRIHTLPDAKRYPETEEEYQVVLHRHNTIIDDLLGDHTSYILLLTEGTFKERPSPILRARKLESLSATPIFTIDMREIDENVEVELHWHIWMHIAQWSINSLDQILTQVTDGRDSNLGIVNPFDVRMYYPYDGGGDVFVSSMEERDRIKQRYSNWLSSHPSGL